MTEKSRTVMVIESHQQTIIRRSHRTVTAPVVEPAERTVPDKRKSPERWWKIFTLKTAMALSSWSRRLRTRANERNNRLS